MNQLLAVGRGTLNYKILNNPAACGYFVCVRLILGFGSVCFFSNLLWLVVGFNLGLGNCIKLHVFPFVFGVG